MARHLSAVGVSEVAVPVGDAVLRGDLVVPAAGGTIGAFAHGSGSGQHSPRNRQVAAALNEAGLGTLLVDLLTPAEEEVDRRTGEHPSTSPCSRAG